MIEKVNAYPFDRNKPFIAVLVVLTVVCTFFYFMGGTRFDADMHDLGYKAGITSYSENLLRTKTYTGDKQKYFASSGRTMEEAIHHFESLNNRLDSLQKEGLVKSYTRTGMFFRSVGRTAGTHSCLEKFLDRPASAMCPSAD